MKYFAQTVTIIDIKGTHCNKHVTVKMYTHNIKSDCTSEEKLAWDPVHKLMCCLHLCHTNNSCRKKFVMVHLLPTTRRNYVPQEEEGKKGGGMIYTGTVQEVDTEAIAAMAKEIAAGNIDTDLPSDTDDEDAEEEPTRGQMRFYRRTGHRMAAIQKKELKAVRKAVAEVISAAGGNPSLITATPTGFPGKPPFILISEIDTEMVQAIFDKVEIQAAGNTWGIRGHNFGHQFSEARWVWKSASKKGSMMRMQAIDVKKRFLKHKMVSNFVTEVRYTQDRIHPTSGRAQKVTRDRPAHSKAMCRHSQTNEGTRKILTLTLILLRNHVQSRWNFSLLAFPLLRKQLCHCLNSCMTKETNVLMGVGIQVLFCKMMPKLEKGGDGSLDKNEKPAAILNFPTEIVVGGRGKLLLTYFNGFTRCGSDLHTTRESRMNHIKCMCYQERKFEEGAEAETSSRGSKRPAPSSAEKQNLKDRFMEVAWNTNQ